MVRAADTGVTCVIDHLGRIVQILHGERDNTFIEGVLQTEIRVPLHPETTFYTRHGDLFAHACLSLTIVLSVAGFLMLPRRRKTGFDPEMISRRDE